MLFGSFYDTRRKGGGELCEEKSFLMHTAVGDESENKEHSGK
jgi:hypothetical protein